MASSRKKRAEDDIENKEEMNNVEDDFDEAGSGDELMDQQMEVEFEARMPQDSDFHGIKTLLQQLFLKANVNLSELTNTIISQNYIGNAIKQLNDDDEDDDSENGFDDGDPVFGIMSAINLTERQNDLACVREIISWLSEKCESAGEDGRKIFEVLNNKECHVGLLISERFLNIPIEIAAPSYESLRKDMTKANKKNMNYNFGYYVLISKCYRARVEGGDSLLNNQMFYSNPEDEILNEVSIVSVSFSVAKERDNIVGGSWDDDDDSMEAMRSVMVFTADKYDSIIQTLKTQLAT
ncbi:hypothetical protein LOTGIDRAFT_140700 [Lottia gigantea]|uniref:Protein BCCIP homolog n=1 Tax=Lottia gigantea TaxID=225164 RepID=V4A908_LOTGI|nr:hypothetical protein LOTGIDRAFT_140700 [Lottia gigantea]ESP00429.1 hypothetical protein LOTGIDRAFT_140700 [Lottia gigantea]